MFDKAALVHKAVELVDQQRVGVLCTAVDGLPYGSPLAYLAGERLKWIAFATARGSRKQQALARNPEAAFVIDNRSGGDFDPSSAQTVIATGIAVEASDPAENRQLIEQLGLRSPKLEEFLLSPRTAVFKLLVRTVIYVKGLEASVEIPVGDFGVGQTASGT